MESVRFNSRMTVNMPFFFVMDAERILESDVYIFLSRPDLPRAHSAYMLFLCLLLLLPNR